MSFAADILDDFLVGIFFRAQRGKVRTARGACSLPRISPKNSVEAPSLFYRKQLWYRPGEVQ